MSAQYLVSFNGTGPVEIVAESEVLVEGEASSSLKQREALYYIVAVVTFYALTFILLLFKYVRFRRKEEDAGLPYLPLPPDLHPLPSSTASSRKAESQLVPLRKYGPSRDSYGSSGVTPKVMRVKILPHWLCGHQMTGACDV